MTTSHLENLPLPDHDLLDLQYHLQRLFYGCGGGSGRQLQQGLAPANINPVHQWLESLSDQNPIQQS